MPDRGGMGGDGEKNDLETRGRTNAAAFKYSSLRRLSSYVSDGCC